MRPLEEIDRIMQTIPHDWQKRWCGGENGTCACMGCVQIGNRLIMKGLSAEQCDPERIDETKIPNDVFKNYKITKEEWEAWKAASSSLGSEQCSK